MNAGATAPEWADAAGGAWEFVEKVIPTAVQSALLLQENIEVGYDYLVTWDDVLQASDDMMKIRLHVALCAKALT